jgi:PAS domain S-box-containing protein
MAWWPTLFLVTGITVILTVIGGWLSPGMHDVYGGLNRVILIGTVCTVAGLALWAKCRLNHIDERLWLQSSMLKAVGHAVIATDVAGRIIYWNQSAQRLYGWTCEEARGQHVALLTSAPDSLPHGIEIMRDLKQGRSWAGEFMVKRKDDTFFPAHVTVTPFSDEKASIKGFIGLSFDLTERKRLEQAVESTSQQLREMVDQREQLSEDLHDGMIQSLYAIGLQLDCVKSLLPSWSFDARAGLDHALAGMNHILKELRSHIMWQAPYGLDEQGFEEQVNIVASAASNVLSLKLCVAKNTISALTSSQSRHLLYLTKEAFSNIVRHARATVATIEVDRTAGGLRLRVADNGHGMPGEAIQGRGIHDMQIRALRLGGRLQIVPRSPGTVVIVNIPLSAPASLDAPDPSGL